MRNWDHELRQLIAEEISKLTPRQREAIKSLRPREGRVVRRTDKDTRRKGRSDSGGAPGHSR